MSNSPSIPMDVDPPLNPMDVDVDVNEDVDTGNDADSITSTIEEEPDSGDEWLVNDILAETVIDGTTKYLIDWHGYPLYDASWEPEEHLGGDMLTGWEESKSKEGHKTENDKNIAEWTQAVRQRVYSKMARHEERNLKRMERGLEPTVYNRSLEEYLEDFERTFKERQKDEKPDANTLEDQKPDAKPSKDKKEDGTASKTRAPDVKGPHGQKAVAPSKSTQKPPLGQHGRRDISRPQVAISDDRGLKNTPAKPSGPVTSDPETAQGRPGAASSSRKVIAKPATKSTLMSKLGPQKPKAPNPEKVSTNPVIRAASGPVSNVFAGGKERKKKLTLRDVASDPTRTPQFLRHRQRRLLEKGSRDREGVVVPSQLPAALISLNPAERDVIVQETTSGPAPMPTANKDESHVEVDDHETIPPRAAKKKKKSVHWGDSIDAQETKETRILRSPGPETSLFMDDPVSASPTSIFQVESTVEPKEEGNGQSATLPSIPQLSSATDRPLLDKGGNSPSTSSFTKDAKFGPSSTVWIPLTFEGVLLENLTPSLLILQSADAFIFTHTCLAQNFWDMFGGAPLDCLFRGSVTSHDNLTLQTIADRLLLGSFGILCHLGELCVLLHPSKCEHWKEGSQNENTPPFLKFIIFQAAAFVDASALAPVSFSPDDGNEDLPPGMRPALFRRVLGLEYTRLIPSMSQETTNHHFFLAFPRSAGPQAMFVARWLRSCNADCKIQTSLDPGQWSTFLNLGGGIVIIHEEAAWAIRLFPKFANLLSSKLEQFTFWLFTRSLRTREFVSHGSSSFAEIGSIHLQPIFELGVAILLTPSFFVSQPQQAYVLIKWAWKGRTGVVDRFQRARLIVCAGIDEWLYELTIERTKKSRSSASTADLSHQTIKAAYKTWQLVRQMVILSAEEEPSSLIFAPESIDGNDEQSLVNWFGWWSIMNMNKFRKFSVLGSSETDPTRLTRHIKRPGFLPSSTSGIEEAMGMTNRRPSLAQADSQPDVSLTDEVMSVTRRIESLIYEIDFWCPVVLYKFPVSYWDTGMAYHLGDYYSGYSNYDKCFRWFKPFENDNPYHNTMGALFYTIEEPWDPDLYPQGVMPPRRPWLVMHRPVNVHRKKDWHASELIIWDPKLSEKMSQSAQIYESDLIEAQREMIRIWQEGTHIKNRNQPIEKVWIAGFGDASSNATNSLDVALDILRKICFDTKRWLPAPEPVMIKKGWRSVKPGSAPKTPARQSPGVDRMDIDEPENIGNRDVSKMKAIFQPPRGRISGLTKCGNRLYEYTMESLRRVPDDAEYYMEYSFRPTLQWYREQLAEGRGFEHISVLPWQALFKRYHLPESETE
ncbi:hypothetical protein AK830_g849 [Neonectria ditissima]|uniref:Chromo domain-containing protein n=1 Tax=Neonectria ditissima TaxID=78410 RepID=A0A0P7B6V9_9HYPO|nr:hypothetical protein AK830_g849 [Neonectria ditissima]